MTDSIRNRQLPGRQEAMRLAMGKRDVSPLMKHIAGLDKTFAPMQAGHKLTALRASEKKLSTDEREALDS